MKIAEMHVWFRQYAQQMGMQNVRAILPEQIDTLINTATPDVIDEVVNRNVGTTNDRVITDNAKLASVNALRTLYKVKTLDITNSKKLSEYKLEPYTFNSDGIPNALYFVDFSIRYTTNDLSTLQAAVDTARAALTAAEQALANLPQDATPEQRAAAEAEVALASEAYNNAVTALNEAIETGTHTRWFPIRIVDDAYLADIINDWVLAPRMRTPAMVVYAKEGSNIESTFELYIGENEESGIAEIIKNYYIGQIRCSYIKAPNKVRYVSDIGGQNVDSDLPEQLQIPMLKHAVDLYRASISGSLFAAQQNQQENGRELSRNNARPENDGYQS